MDNAHLLALFRERDEKALAEIDRQWGKLCRSLAFNITKNLSDAEECVNDAYRILWEKIPPAAPDPLLPYLLRIVRNRACGVLRYNRCEKRSPGETLAVEELEELLSPAAEPDTEELKDHSEHFSIRLTQRTERCSSVGSGLKLP